MEWNSSDVLGVRFNELLTKLIGRLFTWLIRWRCRLNCATLYSSANLIWARDHRHFTTQRSHAARVNSQRCDEIFKIDVDKIFKHSDPALQNKHISRPAASVFWVKRASSPNVIMKRQLYKMRDSRWTLYATERLLRYGLLFYFVAFIIWNY